MLTPELCMYSYFWQISGVYILVLLCLTTRDRAFLSLPNVYIDIVVTEATILGSGTFGTWSGSESSWVGCVTLEFSLPASAVIQEIGLHYELFPPARPQLWLCTLPVMSPVCESIRGWIHLLGQRTQDLIISGNTDLPRSFLYWAFLNPFKLMIEIHSDVSDSELDICECWDGVNELHKQEGYRFWGAAGLGVMGWVFPRIHIDLETQNDLIWEHGL